MDYEYYLNGTRYPVSLTKKDDVHIVNIGEKEKKVKVEYLSPNSLIIFNGNNVVRAYIAKDKDKLFVNIKGHYFQIKEAGSEAKAGGSYTDVATDGIIYPSMPGKVIKVLVTEGTEVKAGDGLIIIESMKMENEFTVPSDATVKRVHVTEGEQVNLDQPLIELDIQDNSP